MVDDWFRPIELAIPFADFKRLPRHPAYKYEYFDDRALLTPRPWYQRAVLDLTTAPTPADAWISGDRETIRPLGASDWPDLPELIAAAFSDVPPFAALPDDLRLRAAAECVERTRAGGDGTVMEPACFVVRGARQDGGLLGAVVVTSLPAGDRAPAAPGRPHLTWIAVSPWRARQGVATALLAPTLSALRELGFAQLLSTFLIGNTRSMMWHWRRGFRPAPASSAPEAPKASAPSNHQSRERDRPE